MGVQTPDSWMTPLPLRWFILTCRVLLGFDDKVVRVVPVGQQVSGLLIVHTDVVIREHPREEVVNLSGNIQDVTNSATKTITRLLFQRLLVYLLLNTCGNKLVSHGESD